MDRQTRTMRAMNLEQLTLILSGIGVAWFVVSVLLIWRLVNLLQRTSRELESAERRSALDLQEHHTSLISLLDSIREFMERNTATLDAKAETLRTLIQQAESLAQATHERSGSAKQSTPAPAEPAPARHSPPPRSRPQPTPEPAANPRNQQVIERLAQGQTPEQIARELGLSQREVQLIARMSGH